MIKYVWLVPAFPIIGFIINGLFGLFWKRVPKKLVGIIGSTVIGLSFALAVAI
ncbi:MAG: hypothetical protein JRI59_06395, partial [Deltaproteobacteria bacterium]|nr:hypothetical protein [Deltaproteobacteria bacterium]